MTTTTIAQVRKSLRITDTDIVSNDDITSYIADAVEQINVTDEQAERYLTCWLFAEDFSWDKVSKIDSTAFFKPQPEKYKAKYIARLRQLGAGKMKKVNWETQDAAEF